jgi:hypothetical protein
MAINYAPNYGSPYNLATYGNAYNPQMVPNMNNQMNYNQQNNQQYDDGSFMAFPVQGESGAQSYLVRNGTSVMLYDFDAGKFWIKSNSNGIPQRLRHFVFKEVFPEQEQQQSQNIQSVTREEFDKLSQAVNKLITELGGTNEQ